MIDSRLNYFRRIFVSYLTRQKSQLTFWYKNPEPNANINTEKIGDYYMPFFALAKEMDLQKLFLRVHRSDTTCPLWNKT